MVTIHLRKQLSSFMRDRLFSLIELLVVVAIIGILLSILTPALKSARDKAKEIACANQQKQIWFGFDSYSEDNDEWVLCWRIAVPAGSSSKYYWPYFLRDYLDLPLQKNSNLPRTILRCPSENLALTVAASGLWTPSSYSINSHTTCGAASDIPRFRRPNVKYPSKWSIFLDGNGGNGGPSYSSRGSLNPVGNPAYRHGNGLNALFFDGHVEHRLYNSLPALTNDVFWWGDM